MIKVIDDFLPKTYARDITELFDSTKLPWFHCQKITNEKIEGYDNGFINFHMFVENKERVSQFTDFLFPIKYMIEETLKEELELIRMKANMNFNQKLNSEFETPHIDVTTGCKYVAIWYPMDSDGDTVIYNQKGVAQPNQFTIQKRVSPKHNRLLIFDGDYWHSSSVPKEYRKRMSLNIVLD